MLLNCCVKVAYQRVLQLTYVDELLAALKTLFIKLFEPFLTTFVASLHVPSHGTPPSSTSEKTAITWDFAKAFANWETIFDKLLRGLEDKAAQVCSIAQLPYSSPIANLRTEGLALRIHLAPSSNRARPQTINLLVIRKFIKTSVFN